MILFFDTETTGLPKNGMEVTDPNYPHVCQLAWACYSEDAKLIRKKSMIVKPQMFTIEPDSFIAKHGITQERAEREGFALEDVLGVFKTDLKYASRIVAHNLHFDEGMIRAAFYRVGSLSVWDYLRGSEVEFSCTKLASVDVCKIPFKSNQRRGYYGSNWIEDKYKWPSLMELHTHLFDVGFDGAHDAGADVEACAMSFFELRQLGAI